MKIFCQECGSKHEYASIAQKPKFCQECGNRFGGAVVAKAPSRREVIEREIEDEEEEYEDDAHIPSGVKIKVDLEQNRGIPITSLLGTNQGPVEKFYRPTIKPSVIERAKTKINRTPIEIG
jgi:hypothetical protein